jgi:hypothetical protein
MRTLDDLITFNEANADREMPWFGQEIVIEAAAKGDLSTPEYLESKETARRFSQDEGIDWLMEQGSRRGLPEHHGAHGICARTSHWDALLQPRLGRGQADQLGLRIRAGHAAQEAGPDAPDVGFAERVAGRRLPETGHREQLAGRTSGLNPF